MKKLFSFIMILALCFSLFSFVGLATGEYRTWLQSDSRWGSITFGNAGDTISKSGCALTSIAKLMVHSGAVADNESVFNPGVFCTWMKNNGGFTSQGWLVWSVAGEYTSKFSYEGEALLSGTKAQKAATIASYINDGCVVVAMVKNGGHYVAVDKVAGSTVYIMDSAKNGYTELFGYDSSGITKIRIYKGPHNGTGGTVSAYDTTVDPVGTKYTITSDDGVNLRKGAGTNYDKLTAIPYNTTVTVTKVENGWGYTTYDGKNGWFTLEYAKGTVGVRGLKITPPAKTAYTQGEKMDLTGLAVTVLYSDGTQKAITSGYSVNEFSTETAGERQVYVTYKNKSAAFKITVTATPKEYQVGTYAVNSSDGLNMRTEPNTGGEKLFTLPNGTHVEVTEISENWGKIVYQETDGWICLDYTKFLKAPKVQTGLEAKYKFPCLLTSQPLNREDFEVWQVWNDGTKTPITEYTFSFRSVTNGMLTLAIINGSFETELSIKAFAAIPLGDSNFDGEVNATDALNLLKVAVNKPVAVFHNEVCDLNGDATIDAKDALLVLRFAVKKIDRFPIEQTTTPTDITPTNFWG